MVLLWVGVSEVSFHRSAVLLMSSKTEQGSTVQGKWEIPTHFLLFAFFRNENTSDSSISIEVEIKRKESNSEKLK